MKFPSHKNNSSFPPGADQPWAGTLNSSRKSFTLIELLIVLALVAILSVVVVMTLNPTELLKQARDSNRLSDLSTINTALNLFSTDVTAGFMGTSTVVYVSIPSVSPTCVGLGLPSLPTGYTHNCVTQTNLRNTNGTGWIPVNFQRISSNSPISQLPIDPQNTTSTKYYTYVAGGSWKVMATPESQKYMITAGTDGGTNIGQFEVGNNMALAPFVDGLVGWWKFDEGSGSTAADSSGWGYNMTIYTTSTPVWVDGLVGGSAISLDGDPGNYAGGVSVPLDSNNWTMSLWIKNFSAKTGSPACCNRFASWAGKAPTLWVQGGSALSIVHSGTVDLQSSVPVGSSKTHLAITRSGSLANIYVNGISIKQSTSFTALFTLNNHPRIGGSAAYPNENTGATFDDVRFYRRGLSSVEVSALYDAGK